MAALDFSPAVVGYLERHAVDPELAYGLGVRSDRDDLLYPYSKPRGETFVRRRDLASGITKQPGGEALILWWPAGRPAPGADVLLTEGEPDALAALSALNGDPFTVCAIPGTTIPLERLTAELAAAERVWLALDGDEAGRKAVDRIVRALQQYTELRIVRVGEGEDLASRLYREQDREAWLREALSSAAAAPKLKLKPETGGYRRKKADRTRDLLAKGIDPRRIDGAELLDEIEGFVRRFVVFPSSASPRVIALWTLHSHAIDAADATPYLGIVSPTKRCGKSRLEEVLELVSRNAWKIDGAPSEATLFRKIEAERPAVLLDEADALWAGGDVRTEPLRAIFNSGNRRGATVPRCIGEGKNQEVHDFAVFSPKALSGIKTTRWPDTVLDRCFLIQLRRRARGETVERLRVRKVAPEAEVLYEKAACWAEANLEALSQAEPDLPEELDDRAQDGAEPLLAIADLAGGEWPELARAALLELHGEREVEDDSWGIQLLADIHAAFGDEDRIFGDDLRERLKENPERPWATWGRGDKGLTARSLAGLLRDFAIKPKLIRIGDETRRGFEREWFEDAWGRYLPDLGVPSVTSVTTALESQELPLSEALQEEARNTSEDAANPHSNADVTDVTLQTSKTGRISEEEYVRRFQERERKGLIP